jgi:hypothetical protein
MMVVFLLKNIRLSLSKRPFSKGMWSDLYKIGRSFKLYTKKKKTILQHYEQVLGRQQQ